jgi:hypothetical protein
VLIAIHIIGRLGGGRSGRLVRQWQASICLLCTTAMCRAQLTTVCLLVVMHGCDDIQRVRLMPARPFLATLKVEQ